MIYEYICPEHGAFEYRCSVADRQAPKPCPTCEAPSTFTISAPAFHLEGISGDFPGAAMRWAKNHGGQS